MDFYDLLQNHFATFLLLMTRVSGIFMISPFWGSKSVPIMIRAGLAFIITIVMFPVVSQNQDVQPQDTIIGFAMDFILELFVGWFIGLVAFITLSSINMAGKIMDIQIGFSMVNVMDPTTQQQSALTGNLLYNLSIIIFIVTNGHHMILSALAGSLTAIPLTGANLSPNISDLVVDITFGIFLTGVKIALPVTFAILLTNVALGLLARTMPQMNIFVVGIPMQLTIGICVLAMMIPFYIVFLDVLFNEVYGNVTIAIKSLQ